MEYSIDSRTKIILIDNPDYIDTLVIFIRYLHISRYNQKTTTYRSEKGYTIPPLGRIHILMNSADTRILYSRKEINYRQFEPDPKCWNMQFKPIKLNDQ